MADGPEAVIIGAGHNGLVCACYLAEAGLRVKVFERRPVVGGAAVTEEFHPGFFNSTASYAVSLLQPSIIRDLKLVEHGLQIKLRPQANFFPLPEGKSLSFFSDLEATKTEFARFSAADASALEEYQSRLSAVGDFVLGLMQKTPPNIGGGIRDAVRAFDFGRSARRLPMSVRRDVVALFSVSVLDFLRQFFSNDHIVAALAFDALVGSFVSPSAAGSAYVLLHHVIGEANGVRGAWGHAIGGMGAITQAMLRQAETLGVEVVTDAAVAEVSVIENTAVGVVLKDGTQISAARVVANVGPKLLFGSLVQEERLPVEFRRLVDNFKAESGTLRINVALRELPEFLCAPEPGSHLGAGIVFAPSVDFLECAYEDARRHGWSRRPIVEMLVPSIIDPTLAPDGRHVASLFCQHFAADVDWDSERERAADTVFALVDEFAPNFSGAIMGAEILTPLDLERRFGLVGGDIFHGRLSLDQLWSNRPFMGYANYRCPIDGLYMCGAGTHPGGGVSGIPGRNAAREILRDR